jgi:hypothetical protein
MAAIAREAWRRARAGEDIAPEMGEITRRQRSQTNYADTRDRPPGPTLRES